MKFEYWECPNCEKSNYLGRSLCKKCGMSAPTDIATRRKKEAPTPADEIEDIVLTTLRAIAGTENVTTPSLYQSSPPNVPPASPKASSETTSPAPATTAPPPPAPETTVPETTNADRLVHEFAEEEEGKQLQRSARTSRTFSYESQTPKTPLSPLTSKTLEREVGNSETGEEHLSPEDASLPPPEETATPKEGDGEEMDEEEGDEEALSLSSTLHAGTKVRSEHALAPGTLVVCSVFETSFEIRWEPPKQDRKFETFRVTLFDADRSVRDVVLTAHKSWTFVGLDPGRAYGVAVTCRTLLLTYEGQPSERVAEFYLPNSTLMASTVLKPQTAELGYWFDGQPSSYFATRPFKLYLGTVQKTDGSFAQETKLGVAEMAVRYGLRGTPEEPGLAHTGVSALELFSPYGLGCGTFVDFQVAAGRKAIYEVSCWVLQLRPSAEDVEIAPDGVRKLALRALKEVAAKEKEERGGVAGGQEGSSHLALGNGNVGGDGKSGGGEKGAVVTSGGANNNSSSMAIRSSSSSSSSSISHDSGGGGGGDERGGGSGGDLTPNNAAATLSLATDQEMLSLAGQGAGEEEGGSGSGGGGCAFLHVRDRNANGTGGCVSSNRAAAFGTWEKLVCRTQFQSQSLRAHVQFPARALLGSVLVDRFQVKYIGPSDLELGLRRALARLKSCKPQRDRFTHHYHPGGGGVGAAVAAAAAAAAAAVNTSQPSSLCLCLLSGEDLTYASGALYTSPVLAKVFWRGEFLGQTGVSIGGGDDPKFGNSTFRLPLPLPPPSSLLALTDDDDKGAASAEAKKKTKKEKAKEKKSAAAAEVGWRECQLKVQVVDAFSLSLVGEVSLSLGRDGVSLNSDAPSVATHSKQRLLPAPTGLPLMRRAVKKKDKKGKGTGKKSKRCCGVCGRVCCCCCGGGGGGGAKKNKAKGVGGKEDAKVAPLPEDMASEEMERGLAGGEGARGGNGSDGGDSNGEDEDEDDFDKPPTARGRVVLTVCRVNDELLIKDEDDDDVGDVGGDDGGGGGKGSGSSSSSSNSNGNNKRRGSSRSSLELDEVKRSKSRTSEAEALKRVELLVSLRERLLSKRDKGAARQAQRLFARFNNSGQGDGGGGGGGGDAPTPGAKSRKNSKDSAAALAANSSKRTSVGDGAGVSVGSGGSDGQLACLELKVQALRLGLVDALVSLLGVDAGSTASNSSKRGSSGKGAVKGGVGAVCAEALVAWMEVEEETLGTVGGTDFRKSLRKACHSLGVGKACFELARHHVRKADYEPAQVHGLLTREHLALLVSVYVQNRHLLCDVICEEPDFLEMLVRCLPYDEDSRSGGLGGAGGKLAEVLLEEVGLGKTLPNIILDQFYRLRRIIPLDPRFWKCPALQGLPPTLPPRLKFMFDTDRTRCLPPEQPDMTPFERCKHWLSKSVYWSFLLTTVAAVLTSLYTLLLRGGSECDLTFAVLALSVVTLTSTCFVKLLSAMSKIGVGSEMALICCPLVCCNTLVMVVSMVWAGLILFVLGSDLEGSCDGGFLAVSNLFLGFIGLGLAAFLLQTLRLNASKLRACFCRRCCCCVLAADRWRRRRRESRAGEKATAAAAEAELEDPKDRGRLRAAL